MKYHKISSVGIILSLMIILGSVSTSCTENFGGRNTDPTKLTTLSARDVKGLFNHAEYMAMYSGEGAAEYQYAEGFNADLYAQYSAITATFDPPDRYNIVQKWFQSDWIGAYVNALPSLISVIKETDTPQTKAMHDIALIWKVWIIHRETDYYGPVPYSAIGSDSTVIPYDSQKSIYHDLFKTLDEATADLKKNINQSSYGASDVIYNGDNTKWLKFGNTLRLRLALRVSNVEPDTARQQAESAVSRGVMTDLSDNAFLKVSPVNYNGFNRQAGWNEFRMSSAMESLLKGYQDPRMNKYWQPAAATGEYRGVRNGMNTEEISATQNDPTRNSGPSDRLLPKNQGSTPVTVMYTAEAYFLRAEGAVYDWKMEGTAKELYERGIEMAMRTWGITDQTVINNYINSTKKPVAPDHYFNTPALTDIPVKFSSDPKVQIEQINTQKWLALFPDGREAWANMRRSGYPKRYPLIHSDNSNVPADELIRRIPFLNYDRDRNEPAVKKAASLLKGPDNAGTRLWWDVKK